MAWLRSKFDSFHSDQSGSIAMMFGFLLLLMVVLVGIAIDMSQAQRASATASMSIDSAALAGAKALVEEQMSEADVIKVVDRYLSAQMNSEQMVGASYSNLRVTVDRVEGTVSIDLDMHVPTTFSRIAAKNTVDFHRSAKTAYKVKNVELAMVLDTTGSMRDNNKIAEMKAAASQAIDILMPPGRAVLNRIALAPFSSSVYAGPYANAASGGVSNDCVVERDGAEAYSDVDGSSSPVGTAAVGAPGGGNCPGQPVMPLSKDAASLKAQIDSFTTDGSTAGHIGLAWGWYLISPNWNTLWPAVSQPKPYGDPKAVKAIILMTDGMFNTNYFGDTSPVQAAALCTEIKLKQIKLYTIGFELADAAAQTLLTDCASDDGAGGTEFYNATNGTDLSDAFKKIAGKLSSLRLSQ
jgi:Flp pilus assembly protein TadG